MKNLIIFLLLVASSQSCSQKSSTIKSTEKNIIFQDNDIPKELKTFYTLYFSEMENNSIKDSEANLDILKKKYMTSELYEKLKNIDLDYDPIINGQDVEVDWKKSLDIKFIKHDLYQMCIESSFDKKKYCTFLKVKKTQTGYKIYDFKVNMEVVMTQVGDLTVPSLIKYNGNWKAIFKKRERGIFTATLSNFFK